MKVNFFKKIGDKLKTSGENKNNSFKKSLIRMKFKNAKDLSSIEVKKNKEYYIRQLENENARLLGEYKIIERQIKRELSTYLEPIQNIFSNVDFKNYNEQSFSYIKTQLESFLRQKEYKIFKPEILTMHNKDEMIVEDVITADSNDKDGLIEKVITVGIKDRNNKIVVPAKVRIYKGSEK